MARGSNGECIRWRVQKIHGSPSPAVAEACAARMALLLALELQWSHIEVEGDCIQVINALKDHSDYFLQPFGAVVSACLSFIPSFVEVQFSFIRHMGNCLAHTLAYLSFSHSVVLDGFVITADLAI